MRTAATAAAALTTVLLALVPWSPASAAPAGVTVASKPSPGCAASTAPTDQQTLSFTADGDHGSYVEQVPSSAVAGRPLPVVFDLHGYDVPGTVQVTLSDLGTTGQSDGFVTVTPWVNGEPVPRWRSTVGSTDLAWFGGLLTHVEATSCVDEHRVFVTGYSNGAFMSSAIACQYSARVAAVAPVAGIQAMTPFRQARPVPVVAFHGTADPLVHYDGTASKAAQDLPAPDGSARPMSRTEQQQFGTKGIFEKGPTIPQEAGAWARRNGCRGPASSRRIASDVTLLAWSCPHHADVELYRIEGGGHTWPGSKLMGVGTALVGRTTFSVSANDLMWRFFESHPLTPAD